MGQKISLTQIPQSVPSALTSYTRFSCDDIVRILIEFGADLECQDAKGQTSLMHASRSSLPILVKAGANLDARNGEGKTILMGACASGMSSSVIGENLKIVLEAGPDLAIRDNKGRTALMHDFFRVTPLLVEAGAELEAKDNEGRTALSLHSGSPILLIAAGADVNTKDKEGLTPLTHLVRNCIDAGRMEEAMLRLLDAGAKIDSHLLGIVTKVTSGMNDEIADELTDLLIKHGAEVGAQDENGLTPLMRRGGGPCCFPDKTRR